MTTWVFLRGLARESRHWGAFPALFRERLPGARIVTPDLPGNGTLHAEPSPASVEAMGEHCRKRLAAQGIPGPYHLLGLSLGGMVAAAWACRHPGEVAGCVLINTSLRPFSPFHRRLRPGSYLSLLAIALPVGDGVARERLLMRLTACRPTAPEVVEEWGAYWRERPVSSANALRQLLAAARFQAPSAGPPCPVLVLAGGGDALVHPSCSHQLAERWRADFAFHPGAGHDLPLDDGPWVAREVEGWLCRCNKAVMSGR
ncbi:MAG: alpha/beta fold hydrolase [Actinomycetota bacterium]